MQKLIIIFPDQKKMADFMAATTITDISKNSPISLKGFISDEHLAIACNAYGASFYSF